MYLAAPQAHANDWLTHNRSFSFAIGQQQQSYREIDTQALTNDGVLNRETGQQNQTQAALRWQWHSGIVTQLAFARQNGATRYQGYLQSGAGALTPYSASTGNIASQTSLQVGYALNTSNIAAIPSRLQITPLVQYTQHRWQRDLVQYSETYHHTSTATGLRLQWQLATGTVIEVLALTGRTKPASVSVPAFGFNAQQSSGSYRQWQLGASHDIGQYFSSDNFQGWRLTAQVGATHFNHGTSAVVSGLQAPPNQHRPSNWSLGISKHF